MAGNLIKKETFLCVPIRRKITVSGKRPSWMVIFLQSPSKVLVPLLCLNYARVMQVFERYASFHFNYDITIK